RDEDCHLVGAVRNHRRERERPRRGPRRVEGQHAVAGEKVLVGGVRLEKDVLGGRVRAAAREDLLDLDLVKEGEGGPRIGGGEQDSERERDLESHGASFPATALRWYGHLSGLQRSGRVFS